jgi:tRNA threonylcarbamoyladenosine biosynthesis protein TsaE
MKTLFSRSAAETRKFGRTLAQELKGREVIALFGELGSGKTQFTKGLARALGVTRPVTSPTFTILKNYRFKKNRKFFLLSHFDFYRIRSSAELEGIGLFEVLAQKHNITVIEWPEKISLILPKGCIKIYFLYGKKENERKIKAVGNFSAAFGKPLRTK